VDNLDPNGAGFDLLLKPIPRIQEDAGMGTEIILRIDQLEVLDYWAQAGQEALGEFHSKSMATRLSIGSR
jgi:hypothetical protein